MQTKQSQQKLESSNQAPVSRTGSLKYPQCEKGGNHVGQLLNLVCTEPGCSEKSVICGICYEQQHKGHKIKALKIVFEQSSKYLKQMTPMSIDIEKIRVTVNDTRTTLMEKYDQFNTFMNGSIDTVKTCVNTLFSKILSQAQLKAGVNSELLEAIDEITQHEIARDRFISLMQKLISGVPSNGEEQIELSSSEIEKEIQRVQKAVSNEITKKQSNLKKQLKSLVTFLQNYAQNMSILPSKADFKFSKQLKHSVISVLSDTVVKSTANNNYTFALMEPSITSIGNKPFSVLFKIKKCSSNWIAVGICYRDVVKSNDYQFNYQSLGHGAYMISSNGGSWSSTDGFKNNVVLSFFFGAQDTIKVSYEPDESRVVFTKMDSPQTFTIEFEENPQDELHLCALFYYINDQIEFLGQAE